MIEKYLNKITFADCLDVMRELPDKCIDLILTDPPYGEGMSKRGTIGSSNKGVVKDYGKSDWDNKVPEQVYFDEMFRVSKNQIIFGGNFMAKEIGKNSPCWIVWNKNNTGNYADCELAWTSFQSAIRKFDFTWNGMIQEDMKNKEFRIHPTQKPVGLLKRILREYYKEGVVADFFSGSGSVAVACYDLGIPFVSVEKNLKHYQDSVKRLEDVMAQMRLFPKC